MDMALPDQGLCKMPPDIDALGCNNGDNGDNGNMLPQRRPVLA